MFRCGPWRCPGSLPPCQVDLDEANGIFFDSEQHFVALTASGHGDDRLAEEGVSFGGLGPELCFQSAPDLGFKHEYPGLGQRLRLPVEQVVVTGVRAAVFPG
jgi:hypothetical protein